MKILVCGGRDFKDWAAVRAILDDLGVEEIIHGDARGADELAGRWALFRNVRCREFPAKWERYGWSVGYRRNVEMIDTRPELVGRVPGRARHGAHGGVGAQAGGAGDGPSGNRTR